MRRIDKSVLIYLIIVIIVLAIGGIAYKQIVTEQTPVESDDSTISPNQPSSIKIESEPLQIPNQKIF